MEDLQSLLEKINREGVEKADAEAKRIIDEANKKASAIVAAAREEAAKAKAEAEKTSAAYAERAAETIRQSARDVVIGVKDSVTRLMSGLLTDGVDRALGDEKTLGDLVVQAVGSLAGSGEVVCGAKLANALRARLASLGNFTVVIDDSVGAGFTVRTDGGRVEHSFTGEVIAAELARRLRGDLASLLK